MNRGCGTGASECVYDQDSNIVPESHRIGWGGHPEGGLGSDFLRLNRTWIALLYVSRGRKDKANPPSRNTGVRREPETVQSVPGTGNLRGYPRLLTLKKLTVTSFPY